MTRGVLGFAALALLGAPAYAQADAALVEAAIAAMESRAEPGQRWSFLRTVTVGEESFTATFDPSRPADEVWSLASPASEDALSRELRGAYRGMRDETDADLELVFGGDPEEEVELRDQIEGLALLSEDAIRAVFSFAPGGALLGPGDGGEAPGWVRHLSGELTVAKAAPVIETLRVFAPESFKPVPVARIDEMELVTRFAEIEPGGPVATVSIHIRAVGNALFRAVDQSMLMEHSGFTRVAVEPASDPQRAD
jgi:hypothetical protein